MNMISGLWKIARCFMSEPTYILKAFMCIVLLLVIACSWRRDIHLGINYATQKHTNHQAWHEDLTTTCRQAAVELLKKICIQVQFRV